MMANQTQSYTPLEYCVLLGYHNLLVDHDYLSLRRGLVQTHLRTLSWPALLPRGRSMASIHAIFGGLLNRLTKLP